MIVSSSIGHTVYGESGRPMGTYKNVNDAKKRLAQIEMFKAMKGQKSLKKKTVK